LTAETKTKHSQPGEAENPTTSLAPGSAQQSQPHERQMIMERLLLSPEEAAESLGVCRSRLYDLIRKREITSVRIGRSRRIPVAALRAYVERLAENEWVA
jgi:excisionase family DNA binding protein